MNAKELSEGFRGLTHNELDDMPDHSELFWIKERWIYRDKV
jgi:hypothetical protein